MTWPWSMTQMSWARWSASSRYWVVSSRVVPPATSSLMTSHSCWRLRGSRPVVGSSMNITGGRDDQRGREVEPAAHAAGVGLGGAVGGVGEVERSSSSSARPSAALALQLVELADHLEVLAAGQVLVDRRELAGQADVRGAPRWGA